MIYDAWDTSMTTNTILCPKKAKEIQGLVDLLTFSLDGADAETHDSSRGVKIFETLLLQEESDGRCGGGNSEQCQEV